MSSVHSREAAKSNTSSPWMRVLRNVNYLIRGFADSLNWICNAALKSLRNSLPSCHLSVKKEAYMPVCIDAAVHRWWSSCLAEREPADFENRIESKVLHMWPLMCICCISLMMMREPAVLRLVSRYATVRCGCENGMYVATLNLNCVPICNHSVW
jgi:hypothetical protein